MNPLAKEKWMMLIYRALGQIYVPQELIRTKKRKILHISDTPYHIYAPINRLIKNLKPDVIIHTGDMVDDIKLGMSPGKIDIYQKCVRRLLRILEDSQARMVYVVPGNHDSREYLVREAPWIEVLDEGTIISVDGLKLGVSHDVEMIPNEGDFRLFGHDLTVGTGKRDEGYYLNGIQNINVILYPEPQVYYLPYPAGTNDARLARGKISM